MKNSIYSFLKGKWNKSHLLFISPLSLFLLLLLLIISSQPALPQIYASPTGTGDGTSGNPASFQDALDMAKVLGSQVSISLDPGTYDSPPGGFTLTLVKNESLDLIINGAGDYTEEGDYVPSTILNGGGANHIFRMMANSNNASLSININSIKFQNGMAADDSNLKTWDHGGAVSAYAGNADSSGTIELNINNCVFESNKTIGNIYGGAIATNCTASIYDCIFRSNDASNGGAICAIDAPGGNNGTAYLIQNCKFYDNTNYGNQGSTIYHGLTLTIKKSEFYGRDDGVSSSGNGSCVWGNQLSTSHISQCLFKGIRIKYWGSAFQTFGGNAYIYDCLFIDNKAGELGDGYGALAFYHADQPATTKRIVNCTFYGNKSRYPESSAGGAIHNRGLAADDFVVSNCIFWNNGAIRPVYSQSKATINNSCIQGGLSNTGFTDGGGNITTDPLFADDMYRISGNSPCVNTGNNDSHSSPEYDFDEQFRIKSLIIDMGCFEYDSPPTAIELSSISVDEHISGNTSIIFNIADPDPEDALYYTFHLVEGDGSNDEDNDLFLIANQELYSTFTFDYETKSSYKIYVEATGNAGAEIKEAFVITVNDLNDPVIYNTAVIIDEQRIIAGNPFTYTFPEDLFYDQDTGDTLIYTASRGDNSPLPLWLSFNPATRTFSGTPLNQDEGFLSVKIKAADSHQESDSCSFTIIVEFNTGIDEKGNRIFRIYPNPTKDYLFISFPNPGMDNFSLTLTDMQGKTIRSVKNLTTDTYSLELKGVSPGLYVIKLIGSEVHSVRVLVE